MKRSTATRIASKLEAMAASRDACMRSGLIHCACSKSVRKERDDLLKASVELRRLAAKRGKKKQSKVGA